MKILSIDYGRRNVGLAISDELGIVARRLPGLKIKTNKDFLEGVRMIAESTEPERVLLGMPGSGDIKDKVESLQNELEKELKIPVELVSEDYTSKLAEKGTSRKFKKEQSHSEVAKIILQEYLDHMA